MDSELFFLEQPALALDWLWPVRWPAGRMNCQVARLLNLHRPSVAAANCMCAAGSGLFRCGAVRPGGKDDKEE